MAMKQGARTQRHAAVGDFIRKDGELVKVLSISEQTYYTSDGGCIGFDEVRTDDVLLPSEGYDEFYGPRKSTR